MPTSLGHGGPCVSEILVDYSSQKRSVALNIRIRILKVEDCQLADASLLPDVVTFLLFICQNAPILLFQTKKRTYGIMHIITKTLELYP